MKLNYTRQDAAEAACVSLSRIDDAIREKHLESYLIGRTRLIRADALNRWLDFLQKQSDKGKPVKYRSAPNEKRA